MGKGDFLGEFEQLVLLAVVRLDREAYGVQIRRELEETAGRAVTIGTVYGTLERLEEKGLLRSTRSDPEPVRGGRARRYFAVTPSGERELARTREMFESMWAGVRLAADRGRVR
jgi:DNA-binding PadR family transcriptional regulator